MNLKYSIVIGTLDRSPRVNYLGQTLRNLKRSGLWDSPIPFRLDIIDSGSLDAKAHFDAEVYPFIPYPMSSARLILHHLEPLPETVQVPQFAIRDKVHGQLRRSRNGNAIECLKIGIATGAPWILFIEDDVDVCDDVLGSIDRWLIEHGRRDRHLYTFATPYRAINAAWDRGMTSWDFPVKSFYGNQALAFTRADAISAVSFIEQRMTTWDTGQGFDLLLKEWATTVWRAEVFLSSVPSFVQHIGEESSLHFGRFHRASGWSGQDWKYDGAGVMS